jgi:hypothetical protein
MIALVNSGDLELNTRQIDDNKRFPELVVCMPKPNSCLLLTKKSVGMMEVLDRRGPGGEMDPQPNCSDLQRIAFDEDQASSWPCRVIYNEWKSKGTCLILLEEPSDQERGRETSFFSR